jgi:hypothetical protein
VYPDPDLLPGTLSSKFFHPFQLYPPHLYHTDTTTNPHTRQDDNEISGSRGSAHFVWRCRNCKREHSASVKDGPFAYDAEKGGRQKVLEIDNRGLEFVEFRADVSVWFLRVEAAVELLYEMNEKIVFVWMRVLTTDIQGDWQAKSAVNATKFETIDLSEGEWYDYDEKASEEVSVKEIKWEIRRNV